MLSLSVVLLLGVGFFALNAYLYKEEQVHTTTDHRHAEYMIEGQRVQLRDGVAEVPAAPGSASLVTTRYFGNELVADLNDDGRDDMVFILTQDVGGSGTFYYVVAALNTVSGYVGSAGYLLGDRIAPQSTELSQNPSHKSVIVVNYAERASGEPMTTLPSVGKSVWLKLDPDALQFGTVEQEFPGEADPEILSLTMKEWRWVSAQYEDGRVVEPGAPDRFVLMFAEDGRFSASTDCNRLSGSYSANEGRLSFGEIASTKMFCEGSQETEFRQFLENTSGYHFTARGELILALKFDSGTVTFR